MIEFNRLGFGGKISNLLYIIYIIIIISRRILCGCILLTVLR